MIARAFFCVEYFNMNNIVTNEDLEKFPNKLRDLLDLSGFRDHPVLKRSFLRFADQFSLHQEVEYILTKDEVYVSDFFIKQYACRLDKDKGLAYARNLEELAKEAGQLKLQLMEERALRLEEQVMQLEHKKTPKPTVRHTNETAARRKSHDDFSEQVELGYINRTAKRITAYKYTITEEGKKAGFTVNGNGTVIFPLNK